jgi:hypothetical protein
MGSLAAAPSHYLLRFANETNLTVFLIAQDNEINSLFWLLFSLKEKGSASTLHWSLAFSKNRLPFKEVINFKWTF